MSISEPGGGYFPAKGRVFCTQAQIPRPQPFSPCFVVNGECKWICTQQTNLPYAFMGSNFITVADNTFSTFLFGKS